MRYLEKALVNFWACVTVNPVKDGCWSWKNSKSSEGYGKITILTPEGKKTYVAHRVSYTYHTGAIPEGLKVLHRCDNPECCNPLHLFVGTDGDNAKDRDAKGRGITFSGEAHGCAKLTEADVRHIYSYKGRRGFPKMLSKQFNISVPTISAIHCKRLWKAFTDSIDLEKKE